MSRPRFHLPELTTEQVDYFWSLVSPKRGDQCRNWLGNINPRNGRGRVGFNRHSYFAHRIACFLAHGKPSQMSFDARHLCGNKICCNPDHLDWGTRADNVYDETRGRGRKWGFGHNPEGQRGEKNAMCKLTDHEVAQIRSLYSNGGVSQYVLASLYGVGQQQISRIIRGKLRA